MPVVPIEISVLLSMKLEIILEQANVAKIVISGMTEKDV